MEEVEKLFKSSTEEMEKLLTAKSVVGEPMVVDGYTIVPLLSLGFGFGAGGGGGVKPVAVIIISKDGVRVEPIQGPPSGLEKLGAAIGSAMDKRGHKSDKE